MISRLNSANGQVSTYGYNERDWMTKMDLGTDYAHLQYDYFTNGNLKSEKIMSGVFVSRRDTYTYDNLNRLASVIYDAVGNLATDTKTNKKYVYDWLNRLKEVRTNSTNALVTTYKYNTAGERVQKTAVSPAKDTRYIMGQGQMLTDYEWSGSSWTFKHNYIYGNGQRLAMYWGSVGSRNYYYNDALGSVREMAVGSGSYIFQRRYEPFGSTLWGTASTFGEF